MPILRQRCQVLKDMPRGLALGKKAHDCRAV